MGKIHLRESGVGARIRHDSPLSVLKHPPFARILPAVLAALCMAVPVQVSRGEAMLEYFNTSWKEIERRIPELAEAGYSSLWLPNPCKGASGGFSVGYDPFDRFDLGDKNQAGS